METLANWKGESSSNDYLENVAKNQSGDEWELGSILNEFITSFSSKITFSIWSMLFKIWIKPFEILYLVSSSQHCLGDESIMHFPHFINRYLRLPGEELEKSRLLVKNFFWNISFISQDWISVVSLLFDVLREPYFKNHQIISGFHKSEVIAPFAQSHNSNLCFCWLLSSWSNLRSFSLGCSYWEPLCLQFAKWSI